MLTVGDKIPEFELPDQHGNIFQSAQVIGKRKLVIFFYPKNFTPGCVKEVCSFRDQYEDFTTHGVEVVGISSDSIKSHQKFATKYKLPFRILSDNNGSIRKLFGIKSSMFGLLPGRVTFVIDNNGKILLRFNNQFTAEKHIKVSLKALGI